jgi:hypothetical protein
LNNNSGEEMPTFFDDILTLRGKEIPVKVGKLPQAKLSFYLDNPRLYSIVREGGGEPSQDEIEEKLAKMDHVKHLIHSIEENGGLIDAVIVLDKTNVVLEGNSRLAAYRILARRDPIKWGEIKVKVLPESIGESEIFALLGEYHIIGKKDWAPYEQAGYLYRRHKNHNITLNILAHEIGLSSKAVSHLIHVYEFMLDKGEKDISRWSYYDEYLKSNKIKKAREEYPELDEVVVKKVRSGEISRAVDVRDDLKLICDAGGKTLHRFVAEAMNFEDSVQAAEHRGAGDQVYTRLKKFKEWSAENTTEEDLLELKGEVRKKCAFELDKIRKRVDALLKKLNGVG